MFDWCFWRILEYWPFQILPPEGTIPSAKEGSIIETRMSEISLSDVQYAGVPSYLKKTIRFTAHCLS